MKTQLTGINFRPKQHQNLLKQSINEET